MCSTLAAAQAATAAGHHDGAVGEIEHAGDAEDQREAGGAEGVEGTDGKAVDQDLKSMH